MNMVKLVRASTIFCLVIATTLIHCSTALAKKDNWDEWVENFFRPLTYDNFDPKDFGKEVSEEDKAILERFKPVIYLAPDGIAPINFYDDYIPYVKIINRSKKGAPQSATRALLKSVERDKNYALEFLGSYSEFKSHESVGYGQVIRELVNFRVDGDKRLEVPLTFLRYNFVFIKSGLPKKLGWIKEVGASLIGDPDLWHPLDIHGAVHVVLMDELPVAVILAQHNYHRTYLTDDLEFAGDRVEIGFSQRSNEPYPAPRESKPAEHYAADTPEKIRYILTGKSANLKTGIDVVYGKNSGGRKVEYKLKFVPDKDPLYTSWIPLGERLLFLNLFESWYRSAPPGMDLRTWPALKRYGELMQFWFVKENDNDEAEFMAENIIDFYTVNFEKILKRNGARLFEALEKKLATKK